MGDNQIVQKCSLFKFNSYLPTTMICFETSLVLNEGPSVVTSQLNFPDRLKPTSRRNTCVAFDTDNCNNTSIVFYNRIHSV